MDSKAIFEILNDVSVFFKDMHQKCETQIKNYKTPKSKKVKDPNQPKKPQSSFFIYMRDKKESLKEKYPNLSVVEISKKLGEKWKNLSQEKKQVYIDKANEEQKIYEQKKQDYETKKNVEQVEPKKKVKLDESDASPKKKRKQSQ